MTSSAVRSTDRSDQTAATFRSHSAADRFMRGLLRVDTVDPRCYAGAHRAFQTSIAVSAIRCTITYLLIPLVLPVFAMMDWVAAPVGIVLCLIAVVNGVIAVRRFWRSDHRARWMYTAFIGIVFVVLALALYSEVSRWMVNA